MVVARNSKGVKILLLLLFSYLLHLGMVAFYSRAWLRIKV